MADRAYLERFSRELADKGKLIEAGWIGLRLACDLEDAPVDEALKLRNALNEVTTNGRWSDGEQRGDWIISKEVYETARDATGKGEP